MSKYANVYDGVVMQVLETDGDITQMFHPDMIWVDITALDPSPEERWTYDGLVFSAPIPVAPPVDELAQAARQQRDGFLRSVYDPGIMMALRARRQAETSDEIAYTESKIEELDLYAEALQAIPEQEDFPHEIQWPVAPTK